MSREGSLPFPRGQYVDSAGAFDHLVGREYLVEDVDWGANGQAKPVRSGSMVKIRLVKNSAGIALLPKRLVTFKTPAAKEIDGYVRLPNTKCFPVDEFLPAAGVPDGAYFYVVVNGPAMLITDSSNVTTNILTAGDWITAATNASTQNSTAGRLGKADFTTAATGATLADAINNRVARAISAVAASTVVDTDVLAYVGQW